MTLPNNIEHNRQQQCRYKTMQLHLRKNMYYGMPLLHFCKRNYVSKDSSEKCYFYKKITWLRPTHVCRIRFFLWPIIVFNPQCAKVLRYKANKSYNFINKEPNIYYEKEKQTNTIFDCHIVTRELGLYLSIAMRTYIYYLLSNNW